MIVRENISFERGRDPKEALGIHFYEGQLVVDKRFDKDNVDLGAKDGYSVMNPNTILMVYDTKPDEENRMALTTVGKFRHGNKIGLLTPDADQNCNWVVFQDGFRPLRAEENRMYYDRVNQVKHTKYYTKYIKRIKDFGQGVIPNHLNESINFERGLDPKSSMDIGKESLIKYDFDSHKEAIDWVIRNLGTLTDDKYNPGDPIRKKGASVIPEDLSLYIQDWARKVSVDGSKGVLTYTSLLSQFVAGLRKHGMLYENINFERGLDPKTQMGIGLDKQFRDAIEKLLLNDMHDTFIINSIAFPKWSNTIDFVIDDWAEDETAKRTVPYLMEMDSLNEFFHIFDFVDAGSFVSGGPTNGVWKFVAPIDKKLVRGLKGKMILAEVGGSIKIIDL